MNRQLSAPPPVAPGRGGWRRSFSALRHRNFRLFWFGQLISLAGTWMQSVAQGWLVLQLTNSAFLLGLVTAANWLPVMLLSLYAGTVTDRVSKRGLIVTTQAASMLQALVLGLLTVTGLVQVWHVIALALTLGLINTFDTPARQSFVVEMVGKDDLMNAVALNSSAFNMARIVGPSIGGVLIALVGVGGIFLLNAVSFVAVIAGLLMMTSTPGRAVATRRESVWRDIAEGLSYIARTPVVFSVIFLLGVVSTFAMNFTTLMPIFARNVLQVGAPGLGFLMAAMGVGGFSGALNVASLSRRGPDPRLLYGGIFAFLTLQTAFALSHSFYASVVLLALTGAAMITFTATANTTVQVTVPDHLRGRVMSVYFLTFGGATPIGSIFVGVVAERWGAPTAMVSGVLISATLAIALLIYRGHQQARAEG